LRVYPFKSLDGADVDAAVLTPRGGFHNDRRFAFVDAAGTIVNGKREPKIHAVRVSYNAALTVATFAEPLSGERRSFFVDDDTAGIAAWLGRAIGRLVTVQRQDDGGFPDDPAAPGPTIVSTATLETVASWFAGVDVESMRRRLRTNIEIDGVPPFWEDTLYAAAGTAVPIRIGAVTIAGTNPCQRCVVPTRDPDTGAPLYAFAKRLGAQRAATLPAWAERSRFDHFYRLAVNTRSDPSQAGSAIRVGDPISV
jgi:uncharacterized protein YcbX